MTNVYSAYISLVCPVDDAFKENGSVTGSNVYYNCSRLASESFTNSSTVSYIFVIDAYRTNSVLVLVATGVLQDTSKALHGLPLATQLWRDYF